MGDTLIDTLNIFVNTPLSIKSVAPVNGYNMASPEPDAEINLSWNIAGIDPWESSRCHVFASYDIEDVWETDLGEVKCIDDVKLVGPFVKTLLYNDIIAGKANDTTVTVYWGIKAYISTENGFSEKDSTDIFRFSTHYIKTDSSVLDIPIVYRGIRGNDIHTSILVISAHGDTLEVLDSRIAMATLHTTVTAQSGIRIVAAEKRKTEYTSEEITINVQPGTHVTVDTITFVDQIQPQVALRSGVTVSGTTDTSPIEGDSIVFYALDNGSGINPNRIAVTSDTDTLAHVYDEPFIKFRNTCKKTCKLRVSVEDYAHNVSPKLYWNISMEGSEPVFSGPFSELGGEQ